MTEPVPPTHPAPSAAVSFASGLAVVLASLPAEQVATLQTFIFGGLGQVLTPIIRQEIKDAFSAFKNTSEVGTQNAELDKEWQALPGLDPLGAARL